MAVIDSINFEKVYDNSQLPVRATRFSVGYDLYSYNRYEIEAGKYVIVDTGIKCQFPRDMWLGIYGRSSLIKKGLIMPLGVGVVDSDYYNTGETIKVPLYNISGDTIIVEEGERIAQGVFNQSFLGEDIVYTERVGGFGSTDNTIEFGGHILPYRRATLNIEDITIYGKVVENMSKEIGFDLVFIANEEYVFLHDGNDLTYDNRCFFVAKDDENLKIID